MKLPLAWLLPWAAVPRTTAHISTKPGTLQTINSSIFWSSSTARAPSFRPHNRRAKFGLQGNFTLISTVPKDAFLKQEELPDGAALGLFAVRQVTLSDKPLFVVGGRRIDKDFLAGLDLPSGMRAMFYQNLGTAFSPQFLIDTSGMMQQADQVAPIIQQLQQQRRESTTLVHWSSRAIDDETIDAIPLTGRDNQLLGVLLIGNSRRSLC